MYLCRKTGGRRGPGKRWNAPDRALFACGDCSIVAYDFMDWIKGPEICFFRIDIENEYTVRRLLIAAKAWVFDDRGYSAPDRGGPPPGR